MFTKQDILNTFEQLKLNTEEYILLMGGSMVVYGFRETAHDLDIALSKEAFNRLSVGHKIKKAKWTQDNKFDLNGMEFFEHEDLNNITSVIKDGIRIQNINSLIEWKMSGGRDKDLRDIQLIQEHLSR